MTNETINLDPVQKDPAYVTRQASFLVLRVLELWKEQKFGKPLTITLDFQPDSLLRCVSNLE